MRATTTINWFPVLVLAVVGLLEVAGTAADPRVQPDPRRSSRPPRAAVDALAPAAPDPLGVSREIWISLRTDNQPGDGTLGSPFNGTGENFDAKMRELSVTRPVTNLVVHLLPGTYETRGIVAWFPRTGWRLRGAGMDMTTLRLVQVTGYVYSVVSPMDLTTTGVEVSDLTVDCNHSQSNSNVASAVALWGSGNIIRRVKAINGNGVFPSHETFVLFIGMGLGSNNEGNLIEECEVSRFRGTYATAIGMGGGFEPYNTNYIQGVIRRNRVYDLDNLTAYSAFNSYGMGGARDSLVEDNLSARCLSGFYTDTGKDLNVTIRGNRFLGCRGRGISIVGRAADNIIIERNFIEIEPTARDFAITCSDSGGTVKLTSLKIRDNVIRATDDRFGAWGGLGLSLTPENAASCLVTGNRIDAGLRSAVADARRAVFFDNTDFTGRPLVTADGLMGNQMTLPVGVAGTVLLNRGGAHVIAEGSAEPLVSGTNLVRAYQQAKAMRPHGQPLGPSNRAAVLLFPGRYALPDSALVLDTPCVDLIGLGHAQAVRLESEGNTLVQTAGDVVIENLTLHCSSSAVPGLTPQDKAAYAPADNLTKTVVRNCVFSAGNHGWSMRVGVTYAGEYEGCNAGPHSWGSLGRFSGLARNCRAGAYSFGAGGTFTGSATDCTAGPGSFGGGGFHGFAKSCTAGDGSFGGSGTLLACQVGGAINGTVATTGKLTDCRIGPAPGDLPAVVLGPGASLYNCTLLANPDGQGYSLDAPASVAVRVAHCRLNRGMRNIVNVIAQPGNVEDPNLD